MSVATATQSSDLPDPAQRASHAMTRLAAGLLVIGTLIFLVDLLLVLAHDTVSLDRMFALDVHRDAPGSLKPTMTLVSVLGGPGGVAVVALIAVLHFFRQRALHPAIMVVSGLGGGELLDTVIKNAVHRPRPHLWSGALVEHSYSFPSGHATAAMATALALCFAIRHSHGRTPTLVAAGVGALVVLSVGFSRVFLGVHWPSDIVGGYALALAWVSLVVLLVERRAPSVIP